MKKTRNILPATREMQNMDLISRWMDSIFKIPGTNFRFGLDGILGLIPGAGDISTLAVSGYLIVLMARNGASGYVLARMVLNVGIDALIGSIPLIGDLFDFVFKANQANMKLMRRYYQEGRYRGGAWKVILPLLFIVLAIIVGAVYLMYKLISLIF
jgi:hypothetical protein